MHWLMELRGAAQFLSTGALSTLAAPFGVLIGFSFWLMFGS